MHLWIAKLSQGEFGLMDQNSLPIIVLKIQLNQWN